jgi:hypothetical protein
MNGLTGLLVSSLAVVVVVLVGWFFFVSPQRSKADRLSTQVDAAHTELQSDTTLIDTAKQRNTLGNAKAAEKALPAEPRVSEILRQLTDLAVASRTELDSISPGAPVAVGSSQALPLSLTFKGRYFGLQKLLKLLRQNATVSGDTIVAKGRLYTVDGIQFAGGTSAPGQGGTSADIQATITMNAFIYHAAPPVATSTETPTTSAAGPTG